MKIKSITIKNFRLLKDVTISLEKNTTVIVGRNNSGKTSLTEIFRRLVADKSPTFSLYDFSIPSINGFKEALVKWLDSKDDADIRTSIPKIEIEITIEYPIASEDLGALSEFIIDLNIDSNCAIIRIEYSLKDGQIDALFEGIQNSTNESVSHLIKSLKQKIPNLYNTKFFAIDPSDAENTTSVEYSKFRAVLGAEFINAQRGLDDITHTEKDVLGKVLSQIFKTAGSSTAPNDMQEKANVLRVIIDDIQKKVDNDFNIELDKLLPALELFGYPGLSDPNLSTETTLEVSNILNSHTKIRYKQENNIHLPETYNGLGSRNLIYILFQLYEFFCQYKSRPVANSLDIIFIEEPEAHLHPQMQQIFIKKLYDIAQEFSTRLNGGIQWPVQFVVTTHSTHIANQAEFEAVRYFLTKNNEQKETTVKDLRKEFVTAGLRVDKEFLHKYLTLTKCDLYFADKAILIEGTVERVLMPLLIEKVDNIIAEDNPKLGLQYIALIEIGGAYAHHFYKFLDFLELRCLVITDIDSVIRTPGENRTNYPSEIVLNGTHTSNSGIKNWFARDSDGYYKLEDCISKTCDDKITGLRRIAYQIPEDDFEEIGRSFEEAFILANRSLFSVTGSNREEIEKFAWDKAPNDDKKSEFALKYALEQTNWIAPKYIVEGLQWLAQNPNRISIDVEELTHKIEGLNDC